MYTPNELRDIKFDKAMFGGYDSAGVDEFITSITTDYTAVFKENAVLKSKLKTLADKVEEYRSVDEAMRKALITAQNMANEMTSSAEKKSEELTTAAEKRSSALMAEAEKKSEELIKNAELRANAEVKDLTVKIKSEEQRLREAKRATDSFISEVMKMYEKQARLLVQTREKAAVPEESEQQPEPEKQPELAPNPVSAEPEKVVRSVKLPEPAPATEVRTSADETAALLIKKIEREIAESEKRAKKPEVESFEVEFNDEANDTHADDEDVVASVPAGDDTKRFSFPDLKFGKNYDFNDEE